MSGDRPRSGITRDEIIGWGGAEVFNQALALCNSGDVRDVAYDDESLVISGKIEQPDGWEMPTSLRLTAGGCIESRCPCAANQRYGRICPHVVALGIAQMVAEMEEAELEERKSASSRGDDDLDGTSEDDNDYIEVPAVPGFSAVIYGSRASLAIEIDAHYGEIDFPACSVQADRTVYLPDPDDDLVRRVRSVEAERAAVRTVQAMGFEPGYREGDLRLYLTDSQKLLTFLGTGLPALRRKGWYVELDPRLAETVDDMQSVVPVVEVRDAPRGDFDVRITFDSGRLDVSPAEIQAAVNRNDGHILKDGRVILLDIAALEAVSDVFRDCSTSQNGAAAGCFRVKGVYAPYVKASLDRLGDCIDLDDSLAQRWRETATARNARNNDARFEPISLGRLEGVLRPYQKQGVYWLRFLEEAGLSGLLADEMGLGKTLQTLTWLALPRTDGAPRAPALIVCPTSLVRNWEAESRKFTPWLKTLVVSGPDRAGAFPDIDGADIVVTSYALLQRDLEAAYLGRPFSVVVLDEAQHIKNRGTKNAKSVKMLDARRRLVLTGTPIENSVADIWSIFDFLSPEYLGDYESFKASFEDPIRDGSDAADEVLARLKRKLHPFILRRLKKTVAKDLPDKIVKVSYCPMSDEAQREYSEALARTRAQAGGVIRAKGFAKSKFELLAMLMKLRQIASRAKVEPFMEQLVSAVEGGHKILVFSQFVTMLKTLSERLREEGIPFCYLDGSTKDRLGECNRFNRTPEIPVFLISLMAGGTGLNLTGADMVMHYDPWWNPAVEDQATDRAHRIGQKKTVYVMKMIAAGSIEEKVLELQRRKQAVIAATVTTTDAAIMESLTAADLNELLS
ncbi:MAG: SNF2 helicase associated domain-containing protein [Kiritimatiellae bacterium]|nr:SNF2 helicase associated domain-containing protein [Kiritimatiellia bacterium]